MTTQNYIVTGRDNPVIIDITGITNADGDTVLLTDFTQVVAKFKDDERNSVDNPTDVVVQADKLILYFGDTTETGRGFWRIWGINGDYPLGLDLTNKCFCNLGPTGVCS